MGAYLLTWNPTKFPWDDYADEQQAFELGFETQLVWSCGPRKRLPIGSRIFMMRLGYQQPLHGIFASGFSTREPGSDIHWNPSSPSPQAHYVEFTLDAFLNLEVHELLKPEKEVSEKFNWRPQSAGVEIPNEIAQTLEQTWSNHLRKLRLAVAGLPTAGNDEVVFSEGRQARVTVNRYERDPKARAACIKYYGAFCQVCAFDFGLVYGEIGEGFIHVHHIDPIASHSGSEYHIDPIRDLRPVCPNCHAMLHRQSPPLTLEELQIEIRRQVSRIAY
ncbi:MAG: HNH endonuclease [Anaerolineae bacterium]|nr:HNH endonuclease [Anaerolineae bacterium]